MFYIVETEEQLRKLQLMCNRGRCFLELVTTNDYFHPALSGLVAVYIHPLVEDEVVDEETGEILGIDQKGYIVPVSHEEGLSVDRERVEECLSASSDIFVLNKKSVLYQFPGLSNKLKDLNLLYSMTTFQKLEIGSTNSTCTWFYNRYGGENNVNQIIPLPKLYERCEHLYNQLKEVKIEGKKPILSTYLFPSGYDFYNNLATSAFFLVEQSGLRVDTHNFVERFKPTNPDFSITGETVYTSYNLYNATSRPTNAFNAVNFLAIPKGVEFRRCFKPFNDKFVEMDFDGYHPRLVSGQIGYSLNPDEKAHKQLAKLYFNKSEVTDAEYQAAKKLNFQMIYGTIPPEYAFLEFTEKLQDYVNKEWEQWKKQGYVENPDSHKKFTTELKDMYPQKLMNYLVQSLETSRNVLILCKVLGFLARGNFKSKIVLITYDSFLIDYSESDGPEVLSEIRKIMEGQSEHKMYGTPVYPVGVKESKDLNF